MPASKDNSANVTAGLEPVPILGAGWWTPPVFAVLALLALLVVPAVVDKQIAKARNGIVLANDQSRVVNDLEASFATQYLVRNSAITARDIPAFATRAKLDSDRATLGAAVREINPEAVALYKDLSNRIDAWDAAPHDGTAAMAHQALDLLASAERLDSLLTLTTAKQRDEVRRLERIDVVTPAILAPFALIAIGLVVWSGRRTLRFARFAEAERAQVVRAAEARAALLRGVTHDVKNPLGAAAGYAQLLEEGVVGPVAPPQLEMVRRIHRLVQTAVQTVTDLLELARADGELHIEYVSSDLATIVDEVVVDHQGMAREHGVTLAVAAPPTPIVTDPVRVRQILANLVSNGIKYTPSGGQIMVSVVGGQRPSERGDIVGVEVRDTGPGIPPELHAKVFEEFFRVRKAGAGVANGNGLGLAISRRIARLLGGDVTFVNADSGGAVFTLWFASPRARPG